MILIFLVQIQKAIAVATDFHLKDKETNIPFPMAGGLNVRV